MKLKEFYNKYINWIVVVLFVLLMFKSCQSCSRDRANEYNTTLHNQAETVLVDSLSGKDYIIDSLTRVIKDKDKDINNIKAKADSEIANKDAQIASLKGEVKHLRSTNSTLININKGLSNKEE